MILADTCLITKSIGVEHHAHFYLFMPLYYFVSRLVSRRRGVVASAVWGADDQLGAVNRITPAHVQQAAALVVKGERHPLGIVIDPAMPAYPPRYTQLQVVQPNQHFITDTTQLFGWNASYNDDVLQMWLGTGPQLDGLGHMGEDGIFYNCHRGADFSAITGLTRLDISQVPPMVTRGVLIDMAKHFDVASLEAGQPITAEDLRAAMSSQKVAQGRAT